MKNFETAKNLVEKYQIKNIGDGRLYCTHREAMEEIKANKADILAYFVWRDTIARRAQEICAEYRDVQLHNTTQEHRFARDWAQDNLYGHDYSLQSDDGYVWAKMIDRLSDRILAVSYDYDLAQEAYDNVVMAESEQAAREIYREYQQAAEQARVQWLADNAWA